MHFYAQNAVPGLYEEKKRKIAKKLVFFICCQKCRVIHQGVIHQRGYKLGITERIESHIQFPRYKTKIKLMFVIRFEDYGTFIPKFVSQ